jgi:hypothetical protein
MLINEIFSPKCVIIIFETGVAVGYGTDTRALLCLVYKIFLIHQINQLSDGHKAGIYISGLVSQSSC